MKKIFFALLAMSMLLAGCQNPSLGGGGGGGQNSEQTQSKTLKKRINDAKSGDVIDLGKEELVINEDESYTIDKPLTIKRGNVKNATFSVDSDGVVFDNLVGIHSVMIGEDVGDGEFDLKDCINVDIVYVNGGGSNSVHIWNTFIEKMYINRKDVRIALKNNATTKVNNLYVSTDCKLDTLSEDGGSAEENKSKLFGNVIINDTVENLVIAGQSSVDKIMTTEENSSSSLVINVEESAKISAADEIVKEVIKENNKDIDVDSIGAVDEDEKDTLIEAGDPENNNRVIILTDWLESKYFQKYCYAWDGTGHLFDGGYMASFDVTSFFNGNLPKEGENVTVVLKGKLDKPLKKLDAEFYDPTVEGWRFLSTHFEAENVAADTEFKIKKDIYFFKGALENVYVRITYAADDLDDRAALIINDKQPAGNLFKVDLTEALEKAYVQDNSQWGSPEYFVEAAVEAPKAKKGDIVNVSFSACTVANIEFMTAFLHNKKYAVVGDELIRYFRDVKAGKTFSGNVDFVLNEDLAEDDSLTFRLYCAIADVDRFPKFVSPEFKGDIFKIDVSSALETKTFINYDNCYFCDFDVTSLFDGKFPKSGDMVQFDLEGIVDKPVKNGYIFMVEDGMANSSTDWFAVSADTSFSLQANAIMNKDVSSSLQVRFQYDTKDCKEVATFIPVHRRYKIDLTDILQNKDFTDNTKWGSPDYFIEIDLSSNLAGAKEGDIVKISFDAVSAANVSLMRAYLRNAKYATISDESSIEDVEAGKKLSSSYEFTLTEDVPEGEKTVFYRLNCAIADADWKAAFLSKDFTGDVYRIDVDSILETKMPELTYDDESYYYEFEAISLFKKSFPKKGDLVQFVLNGSVEKDIRNAWIYLMDDELLSDTKWFFIENGEPFSLQTSMQFSKDVTDSVKIHLQYDREYCDEAIIFMPMGAERFEVDVSDRCVGGVTYFLDNPEWSPDYIAIMRFGSKLTKAPKKNDVITVTFDAVVDANMGSLAGLLLADYDWVSAEIKDCVTGIKAGEKFSFSCDLILTADVPEGKDLGIRIACPITDASRKPTFLPNDFSGAVFEIDLDSVLESKTFEKYETCYFCDFDITSFFSGKFPEPGDLILFDLKGSLNKPVKNGYFFTVENGGCNSTVQWVAVPSDEQFILSGSVIMEKDVSSNLAVRFQYDATDCDEVATFTPAN